MIDLFDDYENQQAFLNGLDIQIENIKENPMYEVFLTEEMKATDLKIYRDKKLKYLKKCYNTLESLQIEIEKQKYLISMQQRNINL